MTMPPEHFDDEPEAHGVEPQSNETPAPADALPTEVVGSVSEEAAYQETAEYEPLATPQPVDDLTLAELIGQFFHAPRATWNAFWRIIQTPDPAETVTVYRPAVQRRSLTPAFAGFDRPVETPALTEEERAVRQREAIRLGLRFVAILIAVYGNGILAAERTEETGLNVGAPYLIIGFLVWIVAEIYGSWPALQKWAQNRNGNREPETSSAIPVDSQPEMDAFSRATSASPFGLWGLRLVLASSGLVFSILTYAFTVGNRFRLEGVVAWVLSILLWVAALAPGGWGVRAVWRSIRPIRLKPNWTLWTLVVIMLLAAYFRLYDLNGTPAEMTSDHVEKILDSQRILDGNPQVFFPNNGGREAIQFYLMAVISHIPGLGMNFFTLKLLTAVEGLISIPILWWMAREMIGEGEPELGNIVGLILAALVAVSYWDVMLSRLGLRIVLTTIFTGLLVIFLSRGLRRNRRSDFIKAGLTLGAGMYGYQAVRMLPVVVIAGVAIAIVFVWFRGRKERQDLRYFVNATVLVVVSLAVFVPMLGFAIQYPDDFWRRTSGRLLGDDLVQTTNAQGQIVERVATLDERMAAFRQNAPILLDNIRNALLMYNWKGDVAWITAAPNRPEMDVYTGALLIIGLGAWLVRMVRRRDAADWLMPPMLFIMLLPSALSLAYPVENPSATRTSGTLPVAYLFAALPVALIILSLKRLIPGRGGTVVSLALVGVILFLAGTMNWNTYFGEYHDTYLVSSPAPYSEAGRVLKGFADSGGSFGNAFMIAYPYWWDHRAVGIEAGLLDWPNGIVQLSDTPRFLYEASQRDDRYRFDPEKDLMFFYSREDTATDTQLKQWFPTGYSQLMTTYKPGADYMLYHVPPLGAQGFVDFVVKTGAAG